jgi:hypothetical protein
MGEKLIVIHSDYVYPGATTPAFGRIGTVIYGLLAEARDNNKKKVRIDSSNPTPDRDADVYIIGNDVRATRAGEVIFPGDTVRLAGIYEDACLASVEKIALGKGAKVEIIKNATVKQNMDIFKE